jgi:hypothetical protein
VYPSSIHLCWCWYVSLACMANPQNQSESTHGRGRETVEGLWQIYDTRGRGRDLGRT